MSTKLEFAKIFIIILILSISQCTPVTPTTVAYEFKCKSNDANSTMTYDNRLEEPVFEDREYAPGYQVSSFNYFEKGRIEFIDTINYYEGRNDDSSDSLVLHNTTVIFNGKRGVSRVFAEGFFPNNIDMSSLRAIRFEEFDRNFSQSYRNLWTNYSSKQIQANAKVRIGQSSKRFNGYDFAYNATIINGVVETRDTMKWINGKGDKRSDWEQTALMRGNISLENNMRVSDLYNICGRQNWRYCK